MCFDSLILVCDVGENLLGAQSDLSQQEKKG